MKPSESGNAFGQSIQVGVAVEVEVLEARERAERVGEGSNLVEAAVQLGERGKYCVEFSG